MIQMKLENEGLDFFGCLGGVGGCHDDEPGFSLILGLNEMYT